MRVEIYLKEKIVSNNIEDEGKFLGYRKEYIKGLETSHIPMIGEILYFEEEEKKYMVTNLIRPITNSGEYFIVEVMKYRDIVMQYKEEERIPLVIDI